MALVILPAHEVIEFGFSTSRSLCDYAEYIGRELAVSPQYDQSGP